MATQFDAMGGSLLDFLGELTLDQQLLEEDGGPMDEDGKADRPRVQLMTMHYAKGLEFDIVFVTGVEEELVPHSRAILSEDLNQIGEERNLFYVAMTRARKRLYISYAKDRSDMYPRWFGDKKKNSREEVIEKLPVKQSRFMGPVKKALKEGELSGYWRTWE
eukprot:jgi/Mesvir1/27499/Mv07268-RA.1